MENNENNMGPMKVGVKMTLLLCLWISRMMILRSFTYDWKKLEESGKILYNYTTHFPNNNTDDRATIDSCGQYKVASRQYQEFRA